jgi:CheY-like chemotaxis protein
MRILLVDDEPLVRETMSELLTLQGADVRTAIDGEEGFAVWQQGRFDLLVTDQRMPRCTGLELVARIRAEGGQLPAVIVSGYGLEGMLEILEQDPKLRLLGKPFETSHLLHLLGDLAKLT